MATKARDTTPWVCNYLNDSQLPKLRTSWVSTDSASARPGHRIPSSGHSSLRRHVKSLQPATTRALRLILTCTWNKPWCNYVRIFFQQCGSRFHRILPFDHLLPRCGRLVRLHLHYLISIWSRCFMGGIIWLGVACCTKRSSSIIRPTKRQNWKHFSRRGLLWPYAINHSTSFAESVSCAQNRDTNASIYSIHMDSLWIPNRNWMHLFNILGHNSMTQTFTPRFGHHCRYYPLMKQPYMMLCIVCRPPKQWHHRVCRPSYGKFWPVNWLLQPFKL